MAEDALFRQLMEQLKAGDQDAATEIFHRYSRRLIGLAASRLPRSVQAKEDPEDAYASAMKSFFARQKKGEFEPESWDELNTLLSYLTVCKVDRRIRKYLTGKRDVRRESAPAADDAGEVMQWESAAPDPTPAEAAETAETIKAVLAKLDPASQQILTLRLQGYSSSEIAASVGKSERTVFRVVDEIRDHVRELLGLDKPEA